MTRKKKVLGNVTRRAGAPLPAPGVGRGSWHVAGGHHNRHPWRSMWRMPFAPSVALAAAIRSRNSGAGSCCVRANFKTALAKERGLLMTDNTPIHDAAETGS